MNKKFSLTWLLVLAMSVLNLSCGNDNKEPEEDTKVIEESIIGKWLLSSSSASEWITYEFTETSRLNVELLENGKLQSATDFYWVNEEKSNISGKYEIEGRATYIDWIVDKVMPFEMELTLFDNNQQIGNASLYRILSTKQIEAGSSIKLDFKSICGTNEVSDIRLLDESVASVDADGAVKGLKIGMTFMTFKTSKGIAAIVVDVAAAPKTFAELMLGSWIYDKPAEKEWQLTSFVADGFISVEWANAISYTTIEKASGHYELDEENVTFSVETDYGMQLSQKWVTEEITEFIWSYAAYFSNELMGKYTGQRLLGSVTLTPGKNSTPDYVELVAPYGVTGYSSHDSSIAKVDAKGVITAVAEGRTYIDVQTPKGAGVFEVYVSK